ncbi:hypothetical protein L7F22_024715, partial [Adiantum nelumboides]|nr:hypothetical protein [Adiantum nelumboides]
MAGCSACSESSVNYGCLRPWQAAQRAAKRGSVPKVLSIHLFNITMPPRAPARACCESRLAAVIARRRGEVGAAELGAMVGSNGLEQGDVEVEERTGVPGMGLPAAFAPPVGTHASPAAQAYFCEGAWRRLCSNGDIFSRLRRAGLSSGALRSCREEGFASWLGILLKDLARFRVLVYSYVQ